MEELYEYNGQQFTYGQLQEKYGDRVNDAIQKFGFTKLESTLQQEEKTYSYQDQNFTESQLKEKYGDRYTEAIEKFGFTEVKKNNTPSQEQSINTYDDYLNQLEVGVSTELSKNRESIERNVNAINELYQFEDANRVALTDAEIRQGRTLNRLENQPQEVIDAYKSYQALNTLTEAELAEIDEKIEKQKQGDFGSWAKFQDKTSDFINSANKILTFGIGGDLVSKEERQVEDRDTLIKEQIRRNRIDFLNELDNPEVRNTVGNIVIQERDDTTQVLRDSELLVQQKALEVNAFTERLYRIVDSQKRLIEAIKKESDPERKKVLIAESNKNESEFNSYKKEMTKSRNEAQQFIDTIENSTKRIGTFEEELDLLKRNYQWLENQAEVLRLGFADVANSVNFRFNEIVTGIRNTKAFEGGLTEKGEVESKQNEADALAVKDEINRQREFLEPKLAVKDINKVNDFGKFMVETTIENIPTLFQFSLGRLGIGSFALSQQASEELNIKQDVINDRKNLEEYNRILNTPSELEQLSDEEIENIKAQRDNIIGKRKLTDLDITLMSSAFAGSEIALGYLGKIRLVNKGKRMAQSIGKDQLKTLAEQNITRSIGKETWDFVRDATGEGFEELGTGTFRNVIEIGYVGDQLDDSGNERSLTDGSIDNFVGGFSVGANLSGTTKVVGNTLGAIANKQRRAKVAENTIEALKLLETSKTPGFTEAGRQTVLDKARSLMQENADIINATETEYKNLPKEQRRRIASINSEIQSLNISKEQVKDEVSTTLINERLEQLDTEKGEILNNSISNENTQEKNTEENQQENNQETEVENKILNDEKESEEVLEGLQEGQRQESGNERQLQEEVDETQTQGDTVINEDVQSGTETGLEQRESDNTQSAIDTGASETAPTVKTYRTTDSDRATPYTVSIEKGVVQVKDENGVVPSDPTVSKIKRKYADDFDFTQGERYKVIEGQEMANVDTEIANTSNNPSELAEVALRTQVDAFIENNVDTNTVALIDYVSGRVKRGKKTDTYNGVRGAYLDYIGRDKEDEFINQNNAATYLRSDGQPIDTLAQEATQDLGFEVTEEDIVNLISDYPNGVNDVKKEVRDLYSNPAKERFTALTGLPSSDYYLKKAVEQQRQKELAEFELENNYLDTLTDEELVSLEREQRDYENFTQENAETNTSNARANEAENTTQGEQQSRVQEDIEQSNEQEIEDTQEDQLATQGITGRSENDRDLALSEGGPVKDKNRRFAKFKRFWRNTFSSSRGLNGKIVSTVESYLGDLAAYSTAITQEVAVFDRISKALKKSDKKKFNSRLKLIDDYIKGEDADISFLTQEQINELDALRGRIDFLSDGIVEILEKHLELLSNDGAIEATENLIETIKNNKGRYVFRQYQAFKDPQYLENLTSANPNKEAQRRLQNAIDFVVEQDDTTPEEAKTQLLTYLDDLKTSSSFASASINGDAKAPFLKKRKDIPEPIRELLGESKDPVANYVSTVFNMSKYIADITYQENLARTLNDLELSSETMQPGYTRLAPKTPGYFLLQDIFVPQEIADGIEDLQPLESIKDGAYKLLVNLAAFTKLGKTVLSPTTTARNFLSGIFLSINNGFNPFANPKKFYQSIQQSWGGKKSAKELREETLRLIRLGVLKDGAVSREVMGIMNDFGQPIDKILYKNNLQKVLDVFQRLYAMGDDAYKAVGFYQWEKRYKKAGLSATEAEAMAVERIRNGFPTYSKIPKNIQKLRRIPLVGTFPSFAYEVWRTTYNNVKFVGQDIKAGRNKMAAQQIAGLAIAQSTALGLSMLSKSLLGIDDDEDDSTRNMAADWQKDSLNIYLGKQNGVYEIVDATAFFPSETIQKPLRILLEGREGRDIDDKIRRSLEEATSAFLAPDILMKTSSEILSNRDAYDKPIYEGENIFDGVANDPDKVGHYFMRQAGPGIYNNITEFARANEIAPEYFGAKENSYKEYTNQEALLGLLGVRVSRINYVNGISTLAYDAKEKYTYKRNQTLKKIKSKDKLDINTIIDEVKEYADYNKETQEQLITGISGAKKQGIPVNQITEALKLSGYSKGDAESMYFGQDPKLKPLSGTSVKRVKSRLSISRYRNDIKKLNEIKSNVTRNSMLFNIFVNAYNSGADLDSFKED